MSRRAVSWIFALLFVALTSLSARAAPARPILTDASTDAWWLVTQRAPVNPSRLIEWLQVLFAVLVAYLIYCFASLGFPL